MMGALLLRGMLVGVLAGMLAFGFAKLFGEPQVERAIAFETQMDAAKSAGAMSQAQFGMPADTDMSKGMTNAEAAAPELVSRATQSGIGLLTGVVTYSTAFGGLFALVFGLVYGRVGSLGPRATAAMLAAAGFVAVTIVPSLKYPANPPSIGLPETIGARTGLFFAMIVISIAAMSLAVALRQRLAARSGGWNATLAGGALFVGLVVAAQLALPPLNEVPENFPATVLWNFRLASIGIQAVLWTTLALAFGPLAEAALGEGRGQAQPRA